MACSQGTIVEVEDGTCGLVKSTCNGIAGRPIRSMGCSKGAATLGEAGWNVGGHGNGACGIDGGKEGSTAEA